MNELDSGIKVDSPVQDLQPQQTAGASLREAREARGLTVAALAASLKVSVKKIEAIETDRFDLLPDIVFARALTLSICRNLKIDANPILEQFPPSTSHHLRSDESGINTPFRVSQDSSKFGSLRTISRPVGAFLIVLVIAGLVLLVFPLSSPKKPDGQDLALVLKNTSPEAAPANSSNQSVASMASSPTASAVSAPSSPVLKDGVSVDSPGATVRTIVFKSRGATWVEVVDAKGITQLRKTLTAGEEVGVTGSRPLVVVVGKADALEVTVEGKPFNLMGIAKDNVARFEVN